MRHGADTDPSPSVVALHLMDTAAYLGMLASGEARFDKRALAEVALGVWADAAALARAEPRA